MAKVLYELFNTYGKGTGEELENHWVADDSEEARYEAILTAQADEIWDDEEAFISGDSNVLSVHYSGDWDDPTGGFIQVTTYAEAARAIKDEMERSMRRLDEMFDEAYEEDSE